MPSPHLHLAAALTDAGWHPAAWREPDARPADLLTADYWTDLVTEAESAHLDFVTFEDSMALQSARRNRPDDRTDQVRGRLDAVLVASRVAPRTRAIGLVPTVVVAHTEPFHIAKAIATVDYVSTGRAGLRVLAAGSPHEAALFGRREFPAVRGVDASRPEVRAAMAERFDEADDYVEVLRRLWDSWEDDAEIRDAATGRFIDRDKLHYIDFEGRWFHVRGPSIVPRPPQGQPVVTALAHQPIPFRFAARAADVVYLTPTDSTHARDLVATIRTEQVAAGRAEDTVHTFADLVVALDADTATATARLARLNELDGAAYRSDALIFAGTPADLADLMLDWQGAGLTGFRLRPAALPHDLLMITRELVPLLRARGAFRDTYPDRPTLRGLLGLPRPAGRYVTGTRATAAGATGTRSAR